MSVDDSEALMATHVLVAIVAAETSFLFDRIVHERRLRV
jgi:hypothetical protein